ncbi:tetratricopeptide repeat protein [Cellulomonas sp. KRMCY2]|uniref:tetratricopeptide repeat protein n=1 Tax=Cellulomonas sp. KRMCY2 TaxID=1304865 RepID=UPI00045EA96C|nr:tetratricopeptide repeat protein [Cellulomonas sp. KRMCY2]
MSQSAGAPAELADLLATVERTANAEPLACLEAGGPALAAARAAGDTDAELQVQYFIGFANHLVSRDDAAMAAMEHALHLARARKDRRWEARVIGGLGAVHSGFGDNASAIEYLEQSLAIRREIGDAFGIAASLNNLGVTFEEMGLFPDRARELLLEAHEMFVELGSSHGQSASLSHLASLDIARSEALAATDPQTAAEVADLALVTARAAIDCAAQRRQPPPRGRDPDHRGARTDRVEPDRGGPARAGRSDRDGVHRRHGALPAGSCCSPWPTAPPARRVRCRDHRPRGGSRAGR